MTETANYQLYKVLGGYLFDQYGDSFYKYLPKLNETDFDNNPIVCMGNNTLQNDTLAKGEIESKASITVHVYGSAKSLKDIENIISDIYKYAMTLHKLDNYFIELEPVYTLSAMSQEDEDDKRLWHGTLDVTFSVK